tara:strand:+ start:3622 stop:4776 length:1155 start_codon:yes stop_codon:yes gene_type:complete
MANTLGNYNPLFYAQEALIQLESQLGMASRVHRGYDDERRAFGKGDTISIRKPGTFTVNNAPATAEDITPETSSIVLDQWKEVKFKLSDKELAYTQQRIIEEHISPAMYAMANHVDGVLCGLYTDVGNGATFNASDDKALVNISACRKIQRDLGVPLDSSMSLMVDSTMENAFLNDTAFSQHQGAGNVGVSQQQTGTIGNKLGYNIFSNQNVSAHTGGTLDDLAGTVDGTFAKGATSVTVDALDTNGETVKAGDTFTIAGDTQVYSITADNTVSGNEMTLAISPPLAVAPSDGAVVTFVATDDFSGVGLAFHKNAFALALAPLPDQLPNNMGAQVATVSDPRTGLAIRSRMYYVGNSSEVHVAFDVLYGVKTLDPNLACRLNRA